MFTPFPASLAKLNLEVRGYSVSVSQATYGNSSFLRYNISKGPQDLGFFGRERVGQLYPKLHTQSGEIESLLEPFVW